MTDRSKLPLHYQYYLQPRSLNLFDLFDSKGAAIEAAVAEEEARIAREEARKVREIQETIANNTKGEARCASEFLAELEKAMSGKVEAEVPTRPPAEEPMPSKTATITITYHKSDEASKALAEFLAMYGA